MESKITEMDIFKNMSQDAIDLFITNNTGHNMNRKAMKALANRLNSGPNIGTQTNRKEVVLTRLKNKIANKYK